MAQDNNIFSAAAIADAKNKLEAEATIKGEVSRAVKPKKDKKLNISLTEESKNKIEAEAARRGMSISALIQSWIWEYCD